MRERLSPRPPALNINDPLFKSTEDFNPSPPYNPVPTTNDLAFPPSPPYDPHPEYRLEQEDPLMSQEPKFQDEKLRTSHMVEEILDEDTRPTEADFPKPKPTVHYPEDIHMADFREQPEIDSSSIAGTSRPPSIAGTVTDDEEDREDYDWSGEDDLVDQEAKFEERMGTRQKDKHWGPRRIMTMLFSSLIGSSFLTCVLVTPALVVHFIWYERHRSDHRHYIDQNIQAWLFWAASNLLISWYLAMIVDIIPAVIRFAIIASWGHVSEFVKMRLEMYNSIKDTIKPLLYAASGWVSWIIIFGHIYNLYDTNDSSSSRASYTIRLSETIEFLFFLSLVVCAQRMLSHAIAFSFHRTAFKERIDAVKETLVVIEKLRQYRPKTPNRSSGTRTPVFGGFGLGLGNLTPFSEKDHFNWVSGALKTEGHRHGHKGKDKSRDDRDKRRSRSEEDGDRGTDGDIEADETNGAGGSGWGSRQSTMVSDKDKGKKKSWMRRSFGDRSKLASGAGGESSGSSPKEDENEDEDRTESPEEARFDRSNNPYLESVPLTHSNLNPNTRDGTPPHTYPPPISPRHSGAGDGDGGNTFMQTAKVFKAAILHDARNIKGKGEREGSMSWNVNSSHEAKRLARSIYMRFKDRRRTYLIHEDFNPAFSTTEEAAAAFRVFDKDNNGDISRAEVKTTLLKVYKERRFLSRSMRDVSVALKTLDQILLFFAFVILFFISLSIFGVNVSSSLTSLYTLGIAASFIFKTSASSAFDAIMFLFVTHPYDTGDRVFIDDANFVVKKMGLFATVFTRSDGTETYYFNSQLFSKFIINVRRSGKMFENLTMQVAWRTPLAKLDMLEKHLNEWLSTEENRWFEPSTSLSFSKIENQRYLEITIGIGHNGTWQVRLLSVTLHLSWLLTPISYTLTQDWGLRNARKTAFHAAVQYYCRQLDIKCYASPIPVMYEDPNGPLEVPSTPLSSGIDIDILEPPSPNRYNEDQEKEVKATLGFLPPVSTRTSRLTRARKSKSRKAVLRASNADGGDG